MSTLKQLVDETTNIKNELKTCHANLKSNLIEKGVECSDADKLLRLANKVGEIELGKKWASGTFGHQNIYGSKRFDFSLDFTPSLIFLSVGTIRRPSSKLVGGTYYISNLNTFEIWDEDYTTGVVNVYGRISNLSSSGFNLTFEKYLGGRSVYNGDLTWYAFE